MPLNNQPTDYDPDNGPEWQRDDDAAEVRPIAGWMGWFVCVLILTSAMYLALVQWGGS